MEEVFISYKRENAKSIKKLAKLLGARGIETWFDEKIQAGIHWQDEIAQRLMQTKAAIICLGDNAIEGWFKEEIEIALKRESEDGSFKVIPVLLRGAKIDKINIYLKNRTWIDFRSGINECESFQKLVSALKNKSTSHCTTKSNSQNDEIEDRLKKLNDLKKRGIINPKTHREFQHKVLNKWFLK